MRIMVTGGAGYIGAHTSTQLMERGDEVLVVDDLSSGLRERVADAPIVEIDLAHHDAHQELSRAMQEHSVDAVIHFAALKQVGESMERPAWYYHQNIGGLSQVLLAMEEADVDRLVFSSSAGVYGETQGAVDERAPTNPINPYSETKLIGEWLVTAAANAWGLRAASLRYFNVAGAAKPELGEVEAYNLVPLVLASIAGGQAPEIFGEDYPTPVGTCVRDYIHVADVAEAHLAVLDWLPDDSGNAILNVGTGVGTSVKEMVDAILTIAGSDLKPNVLGRRAGDAPSVVARAEAIEARTGWTARFGVEEIATSAFEAWKLHEKPGSR